MNISFSVFVWFSQYFLSFLAIILLFQSVFSRRTNRPQNQRAFLGIAAFFPSILIFFIFSHLMSLQLYVFHYYASLEFATYLLLVFFLFQGNPYKKLMILMQSVVIIWLLRFTCVNLLALIVGTYNNIMVHYLARAFANVLAFAFCHLLARYMKKLDSEYAIPVGYWLFMYGITLVEYFCGILINDMLTQNTLFSFQATILQVGLLGIMAVIFYFFIRLCNNYQKLIQHSLVTQQLQMQKQHFMDNQSTYDKLRELQHEFKNQLFYMDYLLDKKDYRTLHQYFRDYYNKKKEIFGFWEAGNNIINAVLNQKQTIALQNHITVQFDTTYVPEKTTFEDVDLCTILSNLMDNAIEGCQGLPNAQIHVLMRMVKNYLHIIVKNSASENILEQNPTLQTTKENKKMHGLGLKIIRALVEKYNGILNFQFEKGYFSVALSLQQPE